MAKKLDLEVNVKSTQKVEDLVKQVEKLLRNASDLSKLKIGFNTDAFQKRLAATEQQIANLGRLLKQISTLQRADKLVGADEEAYNKLDKRLQRLLDRQEQARKREVEAHDRSLARQAAADERYEKRYIESLQRRLNAAVRTAEQEAAAQARAAEKAQRELLRTNRSSVGGAFLADRLRQQEERRVFQENRAAVQAQFNSDAIRRRFESDQERNNRQKVSGAFNTEAIRARFENEVLRNNRFAVQAEQNVQRLRDKAQRDLDSQNRYRLQLLSQYEREIQRIDQQIQKVELRLNRAQTPAQAIRLQLRMVDLQNERARVTTGAFDAGLTARAAELEAQLNREQTNSRRRGIFDRIQGGGGGDLLAIQTQLLTNYTILNGVIGAFRSGVQFVVEFDKSLFELKAISDASDGSMAKLKNTIIEVSKSSRFSATEVAKSSLVLAQAGLSPEQIDRSIGAIVKLATATGSTLKEAVDVTTSAMGAFNLRADEAAQVADTMSKALNVSKLDMEKLGLGIQYAANVAADSGVSFTELTAALSVLANSGIKNGSTLGTGLRQIFIDLSKPTQVLKDELAKLGLTTRDVDIRTQGLVGVLKNLRDAGFGSSQAIAGMEVRAASAFSALTRSGDDLEKFINQLSESGSAAKANDVQMESLANKAARLGNAIGIATDKAAQGILALLKPMVDFGTTVVNAFSAIPGVLQVVGGAFAGLMAVFTTLALSRLTAATATLLEFGAGAVAAAGAFATASKIISRAIPVVGLLAAAITIVAGAFDLFGKSSKSLEGQIEAVTNTIQEASGRIEKSKEAYRAIDEEIDKLNEKTGRLNSNQTELQGVVRQLESRFGEMGLSIRGSVTNTQELIDKLRELKVEAAKRIIVDFQIQGSAERLRAQLLENKTVEQLVGPNNQRRLFDQIGGDLGITRQSRRTFQTTPGGAASIGFVNTFSGSDPRILNALNLVGSTNPRVNRPDSIQALNKSIADLDVAQLDRAQQIGAGGDRSKLQREMDALRKLSDYLKSIKGALQDVETSVNKSTIAKDNEELNEFVANGAYVGIEKQVDKLAQLTSDTREKLRKTTSDDARKTIVRNYEIQAKAISDQLTQSLAGQSQDLASKSGLTDDVNKVIGSSKKFVEDFKVEIRKLTMDELEAESKLLSSEIQNLKGKVDKNASVHTLQELRDAALAKQRALNSVNEKIAENKLQKDGAQLSPDLRARTLADVRTRGNQDLDRLKEEFDQKIEKAGEGIYSYSLVIEKLTGKLEEATGIIKRADDHANAIVRQAKTRLSTAQSEQNQNTVTDAQVYFLRKQVFDAETAGLVEKIRGREAALATQRAAQSAFKSTTGQDFEAAQVEADLQKRLLQGEQAKGNDANPTLLKQYKEQFNQAQRRANDLQAQYLSTDEKILATEQQLIDLRDELAIRTQKLNEQPLGQVVEQTTQMWLQKSGALDSNARRLGQTLTGVFDASARSFSDFVTNVSSGTMTVGQAFRSMAVTILKAVQEILAQKVAQQLIGLVISAAGAAFGSSTGISGDAGNTSVTGGSFAPESLVTGGPVRAAAGYAVPTRDSVHLFAQPGEYLLRQSAVQAIGKENLDFINAMGNRTIQKSGVQRDPAAEAVAKESSGSVVNVWLVSKDQQPPMGKNDIVAVITDDLMRGGPVKKLVKQVAIGGL